jgi:uncharacterized spore protein YtfJ
MRTPQTTIDTAVLDTIRGAHDALSVKRVFGDPQLAGDVTIVPVARIVGGAGGGGGQGPATSGNDARAGAPFAARARDGTHTAVQVRW